MKKLWLAICAAMALLGGGCGTGNEPAVVDNIKYPYNAPTEKAYRITQNYQSLKVGMPQTDVQQLLGEPDEKNHLYNNADHFESRKSDGEVWLYLVQRLKPYGGSYERKEKSVRLEFDLNRKLTRIEPIGMSGAASGVIKNKKGRTGIPGAAY